MFKFKEIRFGSFGGSLSSRIESAVDSWRLKKKAEKIHVEINSASSTPVKHEVSEKLKAILFKIEISGDEKKKKFIEKLFDEKMLKVVENFDNEMVYAFDDWESEIIKKFGE